jgi:hypothetical protein
MTDAALDARRIRAARNQSMFREVNERIVELSGRWAADSRFVCECESAECAETLALTPEEYEAVRADPGSFLVAHGHDVPEVEDVVWENDGFIVVRKIGEGYAVAARYDPRKHTADAD